MTILFSTHILNDAEEVCDDLLLLHKGEIIEAGSILELRKKYQTSVIELEFQDNPEQYLEKLRALPSGTSSYLDRNTIKIPAADISKVRYEVLKAATEENWPLVEFHLNRASLEEMFMKAVKK